MSEEALVTIEGFKGLNLVDPSNKLQDNELSECVNCNIGTGGQVAKRTGFFLRNSPFVNSLRLLGVFTNANNTFLIAVSGTNLYHSTDGMNWTNFFSDANGIFHVGLQYGNKFYIIRSDVSAPLIEWDGVALAGTAIAGTPGGTFGIVYKDRLFIGNSNIRGALSSRLYFSEVGNLSSTGWPSTNFVDVGLGDGAPLTSAVVIQDQLILFKTINFWNLSARGAPATWVLRLINPRVGCLSKHSIRAVEGVIFFLSAKGIYKTDGISALEISYPISPLFEGQLIFDRGLADDSSAFFWKDLYVIRVDRAASIVYVAYNIKTDSWSVWEPAGGITPHIFVEVATTNLNGVFSGERSGNKSLRYGDKIYNDAGTVFSTKIVTKEFNFGNPANFKRGKWLGISVDVQFNEPFEVTQTIDSVDRTAVTVTGNSTKHFYKHKGPGYFRTWKVTLTSGVSLSGNLTFFGIIAALHKKRVVSKLAS